MKRYWKISCGKRGILAPLHQAKGVISIDFKCRFDLSPFNSAQEIEVALRRGWEKVQRSAPEASTQCWLFLNAIRQGDVVFGYGDSKVLLVGEVAGDYTYSPSASWAGQSPPPGAGCHTRRVRWLEAQPFPVSNSPPELKTKLFQLVTIVELSSQEASTLLRMGGLNSLG